MLPALAGSTEHDVFSVGPVAIILQAVAVQLLLPLAEPAVQLADGTSVEATVSQVVVVKPFPVPAALSVQLATGTLVVMGLPQVIAVQPVPAAAACGVQDATPVGPVTAGAGQLMAVH